MNFCSWDLFLMPAWSICALLYNDITCSVQFCPLLYAHLHARMLSVVILIDINNKTLHPSFYEFLHFPAGCLSPTHSLFFKYVLCVSKNVLISAHISFVLTAEIRSACKDHILYGFVMQKFNSLQCFSQCPVELFWKPRQKGNFKHFLSIFFHNSIELFQHGVVFNCKWPTERHM